MYQKTSEHIESLMVSCDAVRRQFEYSCEEMRDANGNSDPLQEEDHKVVPGLINKYGDRVLCILTTECAAYCRFCTRRRMVSQVIAGHAEETSIDLWTDYLRDHPEVREVIVSGGDPFIVPDRVFLYAIKELSAIESIKIIRIGTRAPVVDPHIITPAKLDAICDTQKQVYVGVHFEHPAELAKATKRCLRNIMSTGAILYSQTVFLKGVNDDYNTLRTLFNGLLECGVRPYYIYRCDPVPGISHFTVGFDRERELMTQLRKGLSGLACPTYVIDTPEGSGKIPVPLGFWDTDTSHYTDFEDKEHNI